MNETKIKNYNFPPRGQKPLYFAGNNGTFLQCCLTVKQIAVFLFSEDIVFCNFDCKMLIKDFVFDFYTKYRYRSSDGWKFINITIVFIRMEKCNSDFLYC